MKEFIRIKKPNKYYIPVADRDYDPEETPYTRNFNKIEYTLVYESEFKKEAEKYKKELKRTEPKRKVRIVKRKWRHGSSLYCVYQK